MKKNIIAIVSAAALLGTGANARAETLFQAASSLLRGVTVSVGIATATPPPPAPVVVHATPAPPPPPPRPTVVHTPAPSPQPAHHPAAHPAPARHPVAHAPKQPPAPHRPDPKRRRG